MCLLVFNCIIVLLNDLQGSRVVTACMHRHSFASCQQLTMDSTHR